MTTTLERPANSLPALPPLTGSTAAERDALAKPLRAQAVRGGATFLSARLLTQVLQLGLTLFVVRLLSPADYGLMATAIIYVGLADVLAESGISRALIHKQTLTATDLNQAFTLSLALAAALYALLFAASPAIARHLGSPQFETLLQVCGGVLLLVPFQTVASARLERDLRYGVQSVVLTTSALTQGALVFGLALTGHGVWSLATGILAGRAVQTIGSVIATGVRPRLAWPGAEGAGLLRFGFSLSMSSLIWFAYSNSDVAVVSAGMGTVVAGYYSIALQLIMMPVEKISAVVNQVAYASYCKLQNEPARMRDWFARLITLRALVTMPVLIGIGLVAGDAVPLLIGERWLPAVSLLQLQAPVACLLIISASFSPLFTALGRPDLNFKYMLAIAIVMPASFIVGCRLGGAAGVCVAWLVAYPMLVAAMIHLTREITGIRLADVERMLSPILRGLVVMVIAVLLVRWKLLDQFEPIPRLVVSVLTGATAFAASLWLLSPDNLKADVEGVIRDLRLPAIRIPVSPLARLAPGISRLQRQYAPRIKTIALVALLVGLCVLAGLKSPRATIPLLIGLAGLACIAAALEFTARLVLRYRAPVHLQQPFARYELQTDRAILPKLSPRTVFSTNAAGARGGPLQPPQYGTVLRMLACGGGAVEGFMLDDTEAWPAVLQARLDIEGAAPHLGADRACVWNIGRSGITPDGLLFALPQELPRFAPLDVVFVMTGGAAVNQWTRAGTPSILPPLEAPWAAVACHGMGPWDWRPHQTALAELVRRHYVWWLRPTTKLDHVGRSLAASRRMRADAREILEQTGDPSAWIAHYERTLANVVALARQHARHVVLIRQAWFDKPDPSAAEQAMLWHGAVEDAAGEPTGTYYSHAVFCDLMRHVGDATARVGARTETLVLDPMSALEPSALTFYDHLNLTPEGARIFGEYIAAELLEHFVPDDQAPSRAAAAASSTPAHAPAGAVPRAQAPPCATSVRATGPAAAVSL